MPLMDALGHAGHIVGQAVGTCLCPGQQIGSKLTQSQPEGRKEASDLCAVNLELEFMKPIEPLV